MATRLTSKKVAHSAPSKIPVRSPHTRLMSYVEMTVQQEYSV